MMLINMALTMISLKSNTLYYGGAVVLERLVSFFLLPVLTKSVSAEEFAIWSQTTVVAGTIVPVVLFGFQTAVVKFFPGESVDPKRRDAVLLAMTLFVFTILAVLIAAATLQEQRVAEWVYGTIEADVFVLALATLLVAEALFEFLVGCLRAAYRIKRIALYLFVKGVFRFGVMLALLYGTSMSFIAIMSIYVATQALLVLLFFLTDMRISALLRAGLGHSFGMWREIFAFSAPLAVVAVLTATHSFADRIFLAHLLDLHELAVYSATYSLVAATSVFYSVLGFTLFPALAGLWAKGQFESAAGLASHAIHIFLFFAVPVVLTLAVVSGSLMPLITTAAYQAPPLLFVLQGVAIVAFGLYQIMLYIVLLEGRSLANMINMSVAVAVNLALNTVLIPYLGILGAALSAACSNILLAGLAYWMAKQTETFFFPLRRGLFIMVKAIVASVVLSLLMGVSPGLLQWDMLLVLTLIAAGVYLLLDWVDNHSLLRTFIPKT